MNRGALNAILRLEAELVSRAGLTLCLSVRQVEILRLRNPAFVARIAHFPLGVVEEFLNPGPGASPLPLSVGYVGNLSDRIDWGFVSNVAIRALSLCRQPWQRNRRSVATTPRIRAILALPNVEAPFSRMRSASIIGAMR
jgi:hypothetical protein